MASIYNQKRAVNHTNSSENEGLETRHKRDGPGNPTKDLTENRAQGARDPQSLWLSDGPGNPGRKGQSEVMARTWKFRECPMSPIKPETSQEEKWPNLKPLISRELGRALTRSCSCPSRLVLFPPALEVIIGGAGLRQRAWLRRSAVRHMEPLCVSPKARTLLGTLLHVDPRM